MENYYIYVFLNVPSSGDLPADVCSWDQWRCADVVTVTWRQWV